MSASDQQTTHNPPPAASRRFVFPRWANYLLPILAISVAGGGVYVPTLFGLGASPKTKDAGYAPEQPVPYSHALHVGKLGLDCRYCHTTVESTAFAALPPTQTCMNCHNEISGVRITSQQLRPIRESWQTGKPVPWVKVHDLPDYAYFNHSAHVSHGVGCVECHGRIDQMDVVAQKQPLSMGWCLECHRNPETHLRPRDQITNMSWKAPVKGQAELLEYGKKLKAEYEIRDPAYMTSCYTCHR